MTNSKPSDKSETNKSDRDEEDQSPNERFKSLLKRVATLSPEEVEEVKRAVPAPKDDSEDHTN